MKQTAILILLFTLQSQGGYAAEQQENIAYTPQNSITEAVQKTAEEIVVEKNRVLNEYGEEIKRTIADELTALFNSPEFSHMDLLDVREEKIKVVMKMQKDISWEYNRQETARSLSESFGLSNYNIPKHTREEDLKHWMTLKALDELIHELKR